MLRVYIARLPHINAHIAWAKWSTFAIEIELMCFGSPFAHIVPKMIIMNVISKNEFHHH